MSDSTPPTRIGEPHAYLLSLRTTEIDENTIGHYVPLSDTYSQGFLDGGKKIMVNEGGIWLDQTVWVPKYREFMHGLKMLKEARVPSIELPLCKVRMRTDRYNYVIAPSEDAHIWRAIIRGHQLNMVLGEVPTVATTARSIPILDDEAPPYVWPSSGFGGPFYHSIEREAQQDFYKRVNPNAPPWPHTKSWAGEWIEDAEWSPKFDAFMTALESVAAGQADTLEIGDVRVSVSGDHYEARVPENEKRIWDHIVRQKRLKVVLV